MKSKKSKRALITGITGFVGSHLAELLLEKGFQVYGTIRHRSRIDNIREFQDRLHLLKGDMTDFQYARQLVQKSKPDYIFHLAAQSYVPQSWAAPSHTLSNNITSTCNLLEAVREYDQSRIQIAGSSEEYGLVKPDETPIKETNPLRPMSPYGVSKVATDLLARQYYQSYGSKTIVTRAFNHTGPRRGDVFVCSDFAKQIALIEKGKKEPVIRHGNLEAKRDFTDVRDIVKAYLLAVEKCQPGEVYNICSGKALPIKQVLQMLTSMSKVKIRTEQDPERMRPSDVEILLGDSSKFRKQTGWKPEIPFKQTLEDLLNYWRERV